MRTLLKNILPLGAKKAYQAVYARASHQGYYQGPFRTWQQAQAKAHGYDSDVILKKTIQVYKQAQRTQVGYERDGIWIKEKNYPFALFAHLLSIQSQLNRPLRVLDFGGGLGSTYFQWQQFTQHEPIHWTVVEQSHWVSAANKLIHHEHIQWCENVESAPQADVLILSGVLQYLPEPFAYLEKFTKLNIPFWLIDRTPTYHKSQHQIYIQHIPKQLYQASYPSWVFAPSFEQTLNQIGQIKDEFLALDGSYDSLSLQLQFKGFFLETS